MLIERAGYKIHADLVGPPGGVVVCMLHSIAADMSMWRTQVGALIAQGFQCLRIDFPGHGGSSIGSKGTSVSEMVQDVLAVLDQLSIKRAHVVGLSMGGIVAQGLALEHGDRVISLFVSDSIPAAVPTAAPAWQARIEAVSKAGSLAGLADVMITKWIGEDFRVDDPTGWTMLHSTLAATSPQGFIALAMAIQDFDFTAELPALKIPSMVVYGANDEATPPAANQRLASLIPDARIATVAAGRHLPNVDRHEDFNRLLVDWLTSQR